MSRRAVCSLWVIDKAGTADHESRSPTARPLTHDMMFARWPCLAASLVWRGRRKMTEGKM